MAQRQRLKGKVETIYKAAPAKLSTEAEIIDVLSIRSRRHFSKYNVNNFMR
jgi:hypothetical protein